MKYAIIQTGGKQIVIKPNQWYDLDYIKYSNTGDSLFLKKVLLFRDENKIQLGKPFLDESQIAVKVIQEVKGKKITVLKTKPKKHYTRTQGHRTIFTRVQVEALN